MELLDEKVLYPLQESLIKSLQNLGDPQFKNAKLCGGTALARCWLNHRTSYDLDFFLPEGFKPLQLSRALKMGGISHEVLDMLESKGEQGNQLHRYVKLNKLFLKVSFIEDSYYELFPVVEKNMGNVLVKTEDIPALYHRKLRTIAGNVADGDELLEGRQTARDLFDIYVLSQEYMPIKDFMSTLPYVFPEAAFTTGIVSMPWYDLVGDLQGIVCSPRWNIAKDMETLQNKLMEQVGAKLLGESPEKELPHEQGDSLEKTEHSIIKKPWWRLRK